LSFLLQRRTKGRERSAGGMARGRDVDGVVDG
jgi:hypothetical protein